jgi:dihydroorotate dehydrogenase electron transfer subunit
MNVSGVVKIINTTHPQRHTVRVVENRALSRRYYLLILSRPSTFPDPGAGTFVHLMVPDQRRFFLRRPFSIMYCNDTTIALIVVEKGEGTKIMRDLPRGSEMDLIGPLGSTFPKLPGSRILALGGGVGLAPLYYYGRQRKPGDCESFRLLYGARGRDDLFVDDFKWECGRVDFASDDGSYGFAGNVVDFARREMERSPVDAIFSCGPNAMLKAAAVFARDVGLPHYVSLENRMACALGACRSCVVATRVSGAEAYRTVCNDGPVFDADQLVWDMLPEA